MKFVWENDGPPLTNQNFVAKVNDGYVRVRRQDPVTTSPSEYWWSIELRQKGKDGSLIVSSISVPSDDARAARSMAEERVQFWMS